MLWPLTFVTVRQHHDKAIYPAPLHFTRGNKLVNHHLRTVGKITKLRLPDGQGIRLSRSIAVFKTQYGLFRQNGIDYGKGGLVFCYVLQRNIGAGIPFFAVLIV